MKPALYNRATHFSIVWGVTLAVLTLLEWHSLDRDPVRHEIISPFIERTLSVSLENGPAADEPVLIEPDASQDAVLRYEVDIRFNGPLFLACFFGPVLVFQGIGLLWNHYRRD